MNFFSKVALTAAAFSSSFGVANATTLTLGFNYGGYQLDLGGADAGRLTPGAVAPSGNGALPAGGSGLFVAAGPNNPFTLNLGDFLSLDSLSFIWGSADYGAGNNVLDVISKSGATLFTYTGTQLLDLTHGGAGLSGNQTAALANPWVTLNFGDDAANIGGLKFSANSIAFEASNFTIGTFDPAILISGVPEASSWAMMIVGVGLAGTALRRRKVTVRYA